MKVGDRVRHKRYGYGTVKAVYVKNSAVRVVYDASPAYPEGHETTNAQSRVQVLTAGQRSQSETQPATQTEPVRVRRGGVGTANVDYKLIERMREHATTLHPEADKIKMGWYGGRPYAEIWRGGAADIEFYEEAA